MPPSNFSKENPQLLYYNKNKFNLISDCGCDPEGSASEFCDEVTGICPCKPHVTGPKCPKCEFGYYNFPDCIRMYNVMPVHSLKNSHHFQSQTCE